MMRTAESHLDTRAHMLLALAAQDAILRHSANTPHTVCSQCRPRARPHHTLDRASEIARALEEARVYIAPPAINYARVILEKNPEAHYDMTTVIMVCHLLETLAPSRIKIHSLPLRTELELAARKLGVARYIHVWLHDSDQVLKQTVRALIAVHGLERIEQTFDAEAKRIEVPTEFWWEYPARTCREQP